MKKALWFGLLIQAALFSIAFDQSFGCVPENTALTFEDKQHFERFQELYEQFAGFGQVHQIPKKMHFLWLGPFQPPKQFVKNILSWIEYHPDWEITLWTDRPIETFHPKLQCMVFKAKQCGLLEQMYAQTQNFSERAALAAFALLNTEGGVCIDCDLECYDSIDAISSKVDFFCPVDFLNDAVLSSSLNAEKYIMGSAPGHAVIKSCIQRIQSHWKLYTQAFSGSDKEAQIYRLKYRCLLPLTQALLDPSIDLSKAAVFPPLFFTSIKKQQGRYSHHHRMSSIEKTWPSLEQHLNIRTKILADRQEKFNFILTVGLSILTFIQLAMLVSLRSILRSHPKV